MEVVLLQGYWHWCNHRSEVETLLFCGCFGVLCRERLGQLVSRQWWLCSVVLNHFPTLEIHKSSMKGRMVPFIFSALLTVCRSASENRLDDCKVELNQQLLKDVLPFPRACTRSTSTPCCAFTDEGVGSRETWDPRHLYFSKPEAVLWVFSVISRLLSMFRFRLFWPHQRVSVVPSTICMKTSHHAMWGRWLLCRLQHFRILTGRSVEVLSSV